VLHAIYEKGIKRNNKDFSFVFKEVEKYIK